MLERWIAFMLIIASKGVTCDDMCETAQKKLLVMPEFVMDEICKRQTKKHPTFTKYCFWEIGCYFWALRKSPIPNTDLDRLNKNVIEALAWRFQGEYCKQNPSDVEAQGLLDGNIPETKGKIYAWLEKVEIDSLLKMMHSKRLREETRCAISRQEVVNSKEEIKKPARKK